MKRLWTSIIYENPLPQLRSRQSAFPWLCQCADGSLLASFAIGEAFESVDGATYLAKSVDGGRSWSAPAAMLDKSGAEVPFTDYAKITALPDGRIAALGYAYLRPDPALPLGNPETGGLLEDFIYYTLSADQGESWSAPQKISCVWGPHAEASAPLTILKNGDWVTPITGFPDWSGRMTGPVCGRMLCSHDAGKSWNDDAICMEFERPVTCYEQRFCQLESGALLCIGWNEDTESGARLPNHYTVSYDSGKSWSAPQSSGIGGQASSLCALGGERFLALHAVRRDTDRPGIYGYVVDFSKGRWEIEQEALLWAPATPILRDDKMAEIFAYLKFGQPGAILLRDGRILMSHWYAENGVYKTVCSEIEIS